MNPHLIHALIGVETVHETAQSLVRSFRLVNPSFIRMNIPHKLTHVDDSAEEITQTVQILDDQSELVASRI